MELKVSSKKRHIQAEDLFLHVEHKEIVDTTRNFSGLTVYPSEGQASG